MIERFWKVVQKLDALSKMTPDEIRQMRAYAVVMLAAIIIAAVLFAVPELWLEVR